MHKDGFNLSNGKTRTSEKSYYGQSTIDFSHIIKNIIDRNSYNTLLDYGCGKAFYYDNEFILAEKKIKSLRDYWDIDIYLYDPCFETYSKFPKVKVELSICIDVLEHIPNQDIDWVLHKIFNSTEKFSFINVACYSALALLPNGKNAHTNIKSPKWWFEKLIFFKKNYKEYKNLKIICLCATMNEDRKIEYYPINIDDKMNNYL